MDLENPCEQLDRNSEEDKDDYDYCRQFYDQAVLEKLRKKCPTTNKVTIWAPQGLQLGRDKRFIITAAVVGTMVVFSSIAIGMYSINQKASKALKATDSLKRDFVARIAAMEQSCQVSYKSELFHIFLHL